MLNNYQNEALNRIHQQEQEQQADHSRLAAEAPRPAPFYAPALAQLGSSLITLGNDLQERYGELREEMHQPVIQRRQPAPQR
ncbi:MAG: hypothetical protein U0694_24695 [Anaerolineae bacterium]